MHGYMHVPVQLLSTAGTWCVITRATHSGKNIIEARQYSDTVMGQSTQMCTLILLLLQVEAIGKS